MSNKPLHMIEKPTPRTGATLLARVVCYVFLGRWLSALTAPNDESEWRRTILAKLLSLPAFFFIDNVRNVIDSATLASAITSDSYEDRVIRTSELAVAPIRCVFLATANNPQMSREIAGRTVRIRLDAGMEHPEVRREFRHPDLERWVRESRDMLIWAALTMIQAWVAAGQPKGQKRLGGFERWSDVMGGILSVAAIPGFLGNAEEVQQDSDAETPLLKSFVADWRERSGEHRVGVAELYPLADALDLGEGKEQGRKVRLGKLLESMRDRRFGNFLVRKAGVCHGAQQYRLVLVGAEAVPSPAGEGGEDGELPPR